MPAISLEKIRNRAYKLADVVVTASDTDRRITKEEADAIINAQNAAIYHLMVDGRMISPESTITLTGDGLKFSWDLHAEASSAGLRPPYSIKDVYRKKSTTSVYHIDYHDDVTEYEPSKVGEPTRYRVIPDLGSYLVEFNAIPESGAEIKVKYTPEVQELSDSVDANYPMGYENYIIYGAAAEFAVIMGDQEIVNEMEKRQKRAEGWIMSHRANFTPAVVRLTSLEDTYDRFIKRKHGF